MRIPKGGNGSGKFEVGTHDMGGWTRTVAEYTEPAPPEMAVYLSHHMTAWYRKNPHLKIRCVVPVNRDGNTVELHAWYDQVHFQDISPYAPQQPPQEE
jgi:hypothetical protein